MSASYRFVGERRLRKYTEKSQSPVYATEAEVGFVSTHLCDVPWESANGVRDARMTWHTNENVGDEENPVSGLDQNVVIRDQFDAALFCAGHVGGSHRAYANAACYRYVLPEAAVGRTLESLVASVTSDPYNAVGARIALLTNSTGEIPMDCGLCRNGGRFVNGGYVQDASFHTPDGGVAKRRAVVAQDGSETWYPKTEAVTLEPTGFVLQKYLFVFVLLENYNFCRGNWIEGSSFIENRVSVTLDQAVDGWTEGGVLDLGDSVPSDGFVVSADGSGAVRPGGSEVCVFEASASGHLFPQREVVSSGNGTGGLAVTGASGWIRSEADGRTGSLCVNHSASADFNLDVGTESESGFSASYRACRRIYLSYHPAFGEDGGFVPRVRLRYAKWSDRTRVYPGLPGTEAEAQVADVPVIAGSAPSGLPAYDMLADGTARFVRLAGGPSSHPRITVGDISSWAVIRRTVPVFVGGPSGVYLLGYLAFDWRSRTIAGSDPSRYEFFFVDPVSGAVDLSRGSAHAVDVIVPYETVAEPEYSATFENGVATVSAEGIAWLRTNVEPVTAEPVDGGIRLGVRGSVSDLVTCVGTGIEVLSCPSRTGLRFIVSGSLSSVGDVACTRSAVVGLRVSGGVPYRPPHVEVLDIDDVVGLYEFDGDVLAAGFALVRDGSSNPNTGWEISLALRGTFDTVDGTSGFGGLCVVGYEFDGTRPESDPAKVPGLQVPGSEIVTSLVAADRLADGSPISAFLASLPAMREVYGTSPYDAQLSEDDNEASSLGLRNCYGDLYTSTVRSVLRPATIEGAAFCVSRGLRLLNLSPDGGTTVVPTEFPVWRIVASPFLVPFSLPIDFRARTARLAWGSVSGASTGAKANVWVRYGSRDLVLGDLLSDHRLYDATEGKVGEWTLAGTFDVVPDATTDVALPAASDGELVATVLVTAWISQDRFNPGDGMVVPRGIGTLACDPVGAVTGLGGGLKPTITLYP